MGKMKSIGKSLLKAILLIAIAESAMAASDDVSIAIVGDNAYRMMAASRLTREISYQTDSTNPVETYSSFKKTGATLEYKVYSYDRNWKCYSRIGISQGYGIIEQEFLARRQRPELYCVFKRGQNPQAATAPIPSPVEIKLDNGQVQALMSVADDVGESTMKVSTFVNSKNVGFRTFRYSNWTCQKLLAQSSLPFGSKHPEVNCSYSPDADSQVASSTGRVSDTSAEVSR